MRDGSRVSRHHISQLFDLPEGAEIDFFDANLEHDSPAFIDPFLVKNSPREEERNLFVRYGDFFRYAYDMSGLVTLKKIGLAEYRRLLTFREPRNIYMGYTEFSNEGKGPNLTTRLLSFFLNSSAKKYVVETKYFPDNLYNPVNIELFTDRIGPDGISDISANLLMDYLISYTIEQAEKWNIPLKDNLPLDRDGFDFDSMTWRNGGYYSLPENPLRENEPIIFVPKRFLRGFEEVEIKKSPKSRVLSILRNDPELSKKFGSLLEKATKDITNDEIRKVILSDGSVHLRYLQELEKNRSKSYDFEADPLELLADKSYAGKFDDIELGAVENCTDLKEKTDRFMEIINKELSLRDGWKDCWRKSSALGWGDAFREDASPRPTPQTEPVIGRRIRGMGYSFFDQLKGVTFLPETGTGGGLIDFYVIYKDCKIVIELKLLNNSSNKGEEKIPAYLHGIERQLPHYVRLEEAKYAYYLTMQHYDGSQGTGTDHTERLRAVQRKSLEIDSQLQTEISGFRELKHINISVMPRLPASNI